MKLLVATNNRGKIEEYRELLGGLPVQLVSPVEEDIHLEVDETGQTFAENAMLKARAFAGRSGLVTLADDSGLEVDALNGEPGVFSARYDGVAGNDVSRYTLLLKKMEAVPWEKRGARFRCVIALGSPERSEPEPVGEGRCEGFISRVPHGKHGFGYDPVFFVPQFGQTMAELPPETKNQISHRARAVQGVREVLARQFFPELLKRWEVDDALPPTSALRIRPARIADYVALQRHCYPQEPADSVLDRLRWDLIRVDEGAAISLVAEADGEAVAYVRLLLKRSIGEITSLIVAELFRGRGIARALIHVSKEIARDHGARILTVVVDRGAKRTRSLYSSLGFTPYKTPKIPRRGYLSSGLYMKQILVEDYSES